jgi:hypothetical protein
LTSAARSIRPSRSRSAATSSPFTWTEDTSAVRVATFTCLIFTASRLSEIAACFAPGRTTRRPSSDSVLAPSVTVGALPPQPASSASLVSALPAVTRPFRNAARYGWKVGNARSSTAIVPLKVLSCRVRLPSLLSAPPWSSAACSLNVAGESSRVERCCASSEMPLSDKVVGVAVL